MSSDKYLIHLKPQEGFNDIFRIGNYGMNLTSFGLLKLSKGASYKANTGGFEFALVLLGGKCSVKGKDFDFAEVGARKNVFDGKPHTVYLPRNTEFEVTALTDLEIAVNESPATRDTSKPFVITPEMTRGLDIGKENFSRKATIILTYSHVIEGMWYTVSATNAAALCQRWFRDVFCSEEKTIAEKSGEKVFAMMDALAEKSEVGARGIMFHPYLQGERSPYWDANLRSSFTGVSIASI